MGSSAWFSALLAWTHTDGLLLHRLPVPSRDEIISSPIQQDAPANGATGYYTQANRVPSPVMDDPSADLERELEQTHLNRS